MPEIRIEKDDVIATVILSNPRKLNALNVAMWDALTHAFMVLSQDESLRCVNKKMVRRLSVQPEPLTEQELLDAFAFLASQDYREGVQTFLQKRNPVFSGK